MIVTDGKNNFLNPETVVAHMKDHVKSKRSHEQKRYTVIVDGEFHYFNRDCKKMRELIGGIYSNTYKVILNAGGGATLTIL